MKSSSKRNQEKCNNEKPLLEIMDNAYEIAQRSGFYFPYRKYDWLELNTN